MTSWKHNSLLSCVIGQAINDLMETQFLAAMRHPRLAAVVEEAFEYLEHPGAGFLEDAASAPLQLEGMALTLP